MATAATLPLDAFEFLRIVAGEPEGLCTSWMWRDGRRGFGGAPGDTYRTCATEGLLAIRSERFLLTDDGVALLGLGAYPAGDPSTWSDARAETFYLKGYCHALAVALARTHGYGLGILTSHGRPMHVFALDADGEPHDFDGRTTRERILADCSLAKGRFLRLADEKELHAWTGGHNRLAPIGEMDIAMAMRYIEGRIEKYTPTPKASGPSP